MMQMLQIKADAAKLELYVPFKSGKYTAGCSANDKLLVDSLNKETLVAQRLVYDYMKSNTLESDTCETP